MSEHHFWYSEKEECQFCKTTGKPKNWQCPVCKLYVCGDCLTDIVATGRDPYCGNSLCDYDPNSFDAVGAKRSLAREIEINTKLTEDLVGRQSQLLKDLLNIKQKIKEKRQKDKVLEQQLSSIEEIIDEKSEIPKIAGTDVTIKKWEQITGKKWTKTKT